MAFPIFSFKKISKESVISEFQRLSLSKQGQVQKLTCEKEFHLHENKKTMIFILMALHLASLWNRGLRQLGNSLLK